MSWKVKLVDHYMKVPKSLRELIWRTSVAGVVIVSTLTGLYLYRNPGIVFGTPIVEQSIIQRMSRDNSIKEAIYKLMEKFYYRQDPEGLMLVSWEELQALVGVWVRPADSFPGKSGPHGLTPDMRVLSGPFIFGECESTESLAIPGMTMVACPINNSYDTWGYVAAVVPEAEAARIRPLVQFLAHRITQLVY